MPEFDGISCEGGGKLKMHYERQRLDGCTLAQATVVKGVKLPMGTAVWSLMNDGSTSRAELPPGSELTLGTAGGLWRCRSTKTERGTRG